MEKIGGADIEHLAKNIVANFPKLEGEEKLVSLALYRLLAEGDPVSVLDVASAVGLGEQRVGEILGRWPGVYRDEAGRVVGYWGLAISEMSHRFEVNGRRLSTWCAWDTLFIPELLGKVAQVESLCPVSGKAIRLSVGPDGLRSVEPEGTVVSFLAPDESGFRRDVISAFCHYIHFFESAEAGSRWTADHEGTFLLTVAEAEYLGRRKNALQYGDLSSLGVRKADCP